MSTKPLRRSGETRRSILSLGEAFRRCLVLPGMTGEMALGGRAALRHWAERKGAHRFRVLKVDLPRNSVSIVLAAATDDVSAGDQVRLFFPREEGVYVGGGVVQEHWLGDRDQTSVLLVWLPTVRLVQERRHVRVHIPGARAVLTVGGESIESLVLNLSPEGMMIRCASDLAVGWEAGVKLLLPWTKPIELKGRVVWVEEAGGVQTGLAGIRFEGAAEDGQARLRGMCQLYHALNS